MKYGDVTQLNPLELAELRKLMRRWVLERYPLADDSSIASNGARQTYLDIVCDTARCRVRQTPACDLVGQDLLALN